MDSSTQTLLIVFIALAAVSMLLHASALVVMALGARKAQKKVEDLVADFRLHALPVIISSREVLNDVSPKLKVITENLMATSTTLRAKADQVSGLVGNVTDRAQVQASRVDGMVKATLDQVTFAAQAIEHGLAMPVRQVSGILNGLRAGVDVILKKTPGTHRDPEDDLFV
jgi:hypothetical protein